VNVEGLTELKNFLADRPEWAFLAISLAVNVTLFTCLLRAHKAQLAIIERVLPLAEKLSELIQAVAVKASRRRQGE